MLRGVEKNNGVYYVTENQKESSSDYILVREKEGRIYSDQVVQLLPEVPKTHRYYKEWRLRQRSTDRIITYLQKKNRTLKILDLGCGNGWFSNHLTSIQKSEVIAVDINDVELIQAARVFQNQNLIFIYADIFSPNSEVLSGFDIITMNSCIQYFSNLGDTIQILLSKLNPNGELHLLDSPLYKTRELNDAKQRTELYYSQLGVPNMAGAYFHHDEHEVKEFEFMYRPKNRLLSRIFRKDSPFPWLKLVRKL